MEKYAINCLAVGVRVSGSVPSNLGSVLGNLGSVYIINLYESSCRMLLVKSGGHPTRYYYVETALGVLPHRFGELILGRDLRLVIAIRQSEESSVHFPGTTRQRHDTRGGKTRRWYWCSCCTC